ncbi:hypothetical protein [Mangrovitalea sediminis]|uniref:hypothetical protein n=1 Tax=Mangrovitalea sediminis TaxID=1982043 RepID=UPI0013045DFE|nr:hypothetical protein [Mangrovitalea sediminis]
MQASYFRTVCKDLTRLNIPVPSAVATGIVLSCVNFLVGQFGQCILGIDTYPLNARRIAPAGKKAFGEPYPENKH